MWKLMKHVQLFIPFLILIELVVCEYEVPEPTIEVYKQGGFKVSIPDDTGVTLFAFHGNINKPMRGLEAGKFSVDIVKKENNRWVYENPLEQLNRGDVINYWLYVIRNGLGHQRLNQQYTVVEYTDESNCTAIYNTGVGNCVDELKSLNACMKIQSNILDSLVVSQSELTRLLTKLNMKGSTEQLEHSTKRSPVPIAASEYKNALLIGGNLPKVVPSEENNIQLVNFILWEKLGLNNVDAIGVTTYMEDTYIFELENAADKQKVLDNVKTKLSDSTIYIRNYEK